MKTKESLAKYILENITAEIYKRGLDCAIAHKVRYIDESDKRLVASVVGSEIYQVEFRQGPKYIKAYCDCPYATSNEDYCKHIAAVAIVYDQSNNLTLPEEKEIQGQTLEIDKGCWKKVDKMFEDPLNADLELLAKVSDYSSWGTKPHAKIPVYSTIHDIGGGLSEIEVIQGFRNISKTMARYNFHHYFCAGEISAVFAKTLDVINKRIAKTPSEVTVKIFEHCVIFYYEDYLQGIDDSDGVWQIPHARMNLMYEHLKKLPINSGRLVNLRKDLNNKIDGWGDIFDDLGIR